MLVADEKTMSDPKWERTFTSHMEWKEMLHYGDTIL
jgi:hypothetical protein